MTTRHSRSHTANTTATRRARFTARSLAFLALCVNLLAPSAVLADDGVTPEQAGGAGAGAVAVAAAAIAETRRRKRQKVSRIVTDDAARHGWDAERIRREAVATKRALALKARR